jgi:malate dehydrogenase (oxaloacetate-decarboxylating)
MGLSNVVMVDRQGAIYKGRDDLNSEKTEMAEISNKRMKKGSLAEVIRGADVFIGVSSAGLVTGEMVRSMASKAILFPMANPTPEIMPDKAIAAGAAVVGTGRSDFANQINNVLAFPGIFRGAFDVRARDINDEMKIQAAYAIAGLVGQSDLRPDNILPAAFDPRIRDAVAKAVAEAARRTGVARV